MADGTTEASDGRIGPDTRRVVEDQRGTAEHARDVANDQGRTAEHARDIKSSSSPSGRTGKGERAAADFRESEQEEGGRGGEEGAQKARGKSQPCSQASGAHAHYRTSDRCVSRLPSALGRDQCSSLPRDHRCAATSGSGSHGTSDLQRMVCAMSEMARSPSGLLRAGARSGTHWGATGQYDRVFAHRDALTSAPTARRATRSARL